MSWGGWATGAYLRADMTGSMGGAFTMVCWAKVTAAQWSQTTTMDLFFLGQDFLSYDNSAQIRATTAQEDEIQGQRTNSGNSGADHQFTAGAYDDIWVPMAFVVHSTTNADVYIEDFSNTTNNTGSRVLSGLDSIHLGSRPHSTSTAVAIDVLLAEVAIFSGAWGQTEIDQLQSSAESGPAPIDIDPSNCITYWPLDADPSGLDNLGISADGDMVETGAVAFDSDHPTIGSGPVVVTDVDGDETWNDGDTGLIITGTGFV